MREGLTIVQALRARHDGCRCNPWNEVECGHHYARSLASWSLIPALTGFRCDVDRMIMHLDPVQRGQDGGFQILFSCGAGWGTFTLRRGDAQPFLTVLGGDLDGLTVQSGNRS